MRDGSSPGGDDIPDQEGINTRVRGWFSDRGILCVIAGCSPEASQLQQFLSLIEKKF